MSEKVPTFNPEIIFKEFGEPEMAIINKFKENKADISEAVELLTKWQDEQRQRIEQFKGFEYTLKQIELNLLTARIYAEAKLNYAKEAFNDTRKHAEYELDAKRESKEDQNCIILQGILEKINIVKNH